MALVLEPEMLFWETTTLSCEKGLDQRKWQTRTRRETECVCLKGKQFVQKKEITL